MLQAPRARASGGLADDYSSTVFQGVAAPPNDTSKISFTYETASKARAPIALVWMSEWYGLPFWFTKGAGRGRARSRGEGGALCGAAVLWVRRLVPETKAQAASRWLGWLRWLNEDGLQAATRY